MESPPLKVCPRCGEPRILAPECPRCGVLYARAEARAAQLATRAPQVAAPPPSAAEPEPSPPAPSVQALQWQGDLEDARFELRMYQFALPVALGVSWLLMHSDLRGLLRTFLSMWVHELGHAVTAWFCGFPSIPGPWLTPTWGTRSTVVFLLVSVALGGLILRGHVMRRRPLVIAGVTGLALQFVGTHVLSRPVALQLVTFGGDAGCFILGSLLMATLYAPRDSALRRGWLHWGFLVIGAVAFMDAFADWWAARKDLSQIAFGMNEGVGLSDPSTLVDVYGWSETALVQRYMGLAFTCLSALAVLYVVGLRRARPPPGEITGA